MKLWIISAALSVFLALIAGHAAAAASEDTMTLLSDRSESGDVHTSGVSGQDQRAIMRIGPSATDWMGLSRSSVYWVDDQRVRGEISAQSLGGTDGGSGWSWGWLGLLGFLGFFGLREPLRFER